MPVLKGAGIHHIMYTTKYFIPFSFVLLNGNRTGVVGKQQCTTFGNYKCTKMVIKSAPFWYEDSTKMVIG